MKSLLSALLVIVIAILVIVSCVDAILPGSVDFFCLVEKGDFWACNGPQDAERLESSAAPVLLACLDTDTTNLFLDQ